eukprot:CAMPEP_0185205542 /NCGR_PEP_ID=MMETSP1140-20130426/56809_1 /TAXON_ID=298111 /ORGANISM="Pavlova sp., Strain CCMP459" /LENGTH=60 /DNA_ID=CAMNT_0027773141 /DNA_START=66 /DNA_END=248 /DNA_ORIENTATION=+
MTGPRPQWTCRIEETAAWPAPRARWPPRRRSCLDRELDQDRELPDVHARALPVALEEDEV